VDLRRLMWSEYLGFAGAAVLFLSLFLTWWSTSCTSVHPMAPAGCNANSKLNGMVGDFTAFDTYSILAYVLVLACIAPFVLAWIIARGHKLTWRPGEITMIVGMVAGALILMNGIILGRPGSAIDLSFGPGYWIGLLGAVGILVGGLIRQAVGGRTRKPPGVM
jgi:hypothetical protein